MLFCLFPVKDAQFLSVFLVFLLFDKKVSGVSKKNNHTKTYKAPSHILSHVEAKISLSERKDTVVKIEEDKA